MNVDFECTQCGKCCHNLKVPLTAAEAVEWLGDGNEVQIICDAIPWPAEPPPQDLHAAYKRSRSFPATSGSSPIRVSVILAAHFSGPCPNLLNDMRCAIYDRRPLTCRIYPAEVNPFVALRPEGKECPPEAWSDGRPALLRGGRLVDAVTVEYIAKARTAAIEDMRVKQVLCANLRLDTAALANEGFVVHSPDRLRLLSQLQLAIRTSDYGGPSNWQLVSNHQSTIDALTRTNAACTLVRGEHQPGYSYLAFSPDSN